MKKLMSKFTILTITLIIGSGVLSACTASGKTSNDKVSSSAGVEQTKPTSAHNNPAENKSVEKTPAEETEQTKLVEIYDGRQEIKMSKLNVDEAETVEDTVRAKAAEIKKINNDICEGEDKFSTSSVEGAFTRPNSEQRAYLYELCNDGKATSSGVVGGIVIVESGKPTAHYTLKYYGSMEIISLPDINKNGLSKIGLVQTDGGQGLQATTLSIYEYNKAREFAALGGTEVKTVSFNSKTSNETAYKILVSPSAKPLFYRETYQKKNGTNDWSLSKKSEKFSLDSADAPQPTLQSVD